MSNKIVTLSDMKDYLGITSTSYDTLLNSLIEGFSDLAREYCGRTFDYDTYNETLDIDYDFMDRIILAEYPVDTVVAVTDYDTLVSSDYYYVDSDIGVIKLKESYRTTNYYTRTYSTPFFTRGLARIKVCYTAGYTPYPQGLQLAVKILVAEEYNARRKTGYQSESIGNYKYTLRVRRKGEIFPPRAEALLQQYIDNRG